MNSATNLTNYHCKFLRKIWKDMRDEKRKQCAVPPRPLACKPVDFRHAYTCRIQQDLYEVVFAFVDVIVSGLNSPTFRITLKRRCHKFGRQMASVFRAVDVDQRLSWELLGCNLLENFNFRNDATRIFLWQLFLEQLCGMVFEAFCWSVAKDFTSRPLATIYEVDAKRCFGIQSRVEHKNSIISKIIRKFSRKSNTN